MVPFIPNNGGTVLVIAGSAPHAVALPPGGGDVVMLTNASSAAKAFIEIGDENVVAFLPRENAFGGGFPVLPGASLLVGLKLTDTHIAAISPTDMLGLYVTRGHVV